MGANLFRCSNKVCVYLLPEVPVKPIQEHVFWSSGLSGVGEEVKVHKHQCVTKLQSGCGARSKYS